MAKYGNTLLKLLLLITMVVEPVMFTYAMAGMGHHNGADNSMAAEFGLHCQSSISHDMCMADDSSQQQHDNAKKVMDDCCSTPACGPAAVSNLILPISEAFSETYLPLNISRAGIVLPSEIKPPRSLLG
jgi:hypothetical protein